MSNFFQMKLKLSLPSLIIASISAGHTAHAASIIFNLADLGSGYYTGFNFSHALTPGSFTGTLTAVSINVTLTASSGTYANDLSIYVDAAPLGMGGLLQVGGFSNLSANERIFWPNGGSDSPGTTVIGTVNLATPITFSPTSYADMSIWIGNGYGAAGTSGTWTGTLTLQGLERASVAAVPEPSNSLVLGVFGLVGMASRRVRRCGRE